MEWASIYILTGAGTWCIAQGAKYIIGSIKNRSQKTKRYFYASGGMPSAHSATIVSVVVLIGFYEGVTSAVFGLGVVMAAIVIYDAVMLRRSSGEQGQAILDLLVEQNSNVRRPFVAKGHSLIEIFVGVLLGAVTATIVLYATNSL